jgi:mannose-6-phosphate isomerase-like protein (cupin superfamily)
MHAFEMHELIADAEKAGKPYVEFLRVPDLSMGLYRLPAGGIDPQQPHTEDEVYYVVSGRGHVRVGGEERLVMGGSVVYVAKTVEHKFHSIEEDLTLLVFFAPAEYSSRTGPIVTG